MFWFLILSLLNNLSFFFLFCINVDINEILLLEKNKGLRVNFFRVISLCYFWKGVLISASYISKKKESFHVLQKCWYWWDNVVEKNKGLRLHYFTVNFLCSFLKISLHTSPPLTPPPPPPPVPQIQCSNHWAKESTPWRSCQRLYIYLEAMRNLPRQIIEGRSARP